MSSNFILNWASILFMKSWLESIGSVPTHNVILMNLLGLLFGMNLIVWKLPIQYPYSCKENFMALIKIEHIKLFMVRTPPPIFPYMVCKFNWTLLTTKAAICKLMPDMQDAISYLCPPLLPGDRQGTLSSLLNIESTKPTPVRHISSSLYIPHSQGRA